MMGIFSEQKPYSAVTNWVDQLCSEQYEEDDYTGVPDLCDVARLQSTGPAEAARAIRKKLKYGNVHRQARALTLLDAMLQNGDRRIKLGIAKDEPLLERLRILVSDSTTDSHVKEKAVELFRSWSMNFRNEQGMEQLVGLRNQTPTKKRATPAVRPPTPDNESSSPSRQRSASTPSTPPKPARLTQPSPPRPTHKKSKSREESKSKSSFKPINFEKERHVILQTLAASQQSATNLTNALKRLNRETHNPEDDEQIQQLYRQCRKLRKDILIYIQRTESEEWIGTFINANEELVQTLTFYEKALKPVEQDSDSDAFNASDSDEERATKQVGTQKRISTSVSGKGTIAEELAQRLRATSITKESPPPKPPRPVVENPPAKPPRPTQLSSTARGKRPEEEEDDDDDPFGDQHVINI